jgi:acyl-coenzyme A thioesterase PaaI-like protein
MQHSLIRKQPNSRSCFACGLHNDFGLKARFFESATGEVVGLFRPQAEHQGYPGRLHGGLISTILDEVLARAGMAGERSETWGVTVELNVRFKKPVPLDGECRVIGRVGSEGGRSFEASGELVLANGEVAASATGRYMKMKLDQIGLVDPASLDWHVVPESGDPEAIEL